MRHRCEIAIVGLNYPPEPTGVAPYTGALAAGLSRVGYRVVAHVAHPHYPQWRYRQGYGRWTAFERMDGVAVWRRRHYVPKSPRGVRRLLSELSFGARLVCARWGRPHVIVAVSPSLFSTGLVALRNRLTARRSPLIVWVQDIYTLGLAETGEGGGLAATITRWVEAHTLRRADRVIVIHDRFARYATAELGVDPARVEVIRNWAHLPAISPIDPTAARCQLGWPTGVTLAVHTGNMGIKQGLENIIDAARIADELGAPVHFVLVGDGGERCRLVERARGISRLTIVEPLSEDQYGMALAAADVLLVNEKPGVSSMAVPSKLTSYFHAGRAVIAATDHDGITASEVTESHAGVVIPAGEPVELLNAVLDIRADSEAATQFGSNGQRYSQVVLSENAAIDHWLCVIGDVVGDL